MEGKFTGNYYRKKCKNVKHVKKNAANQLCIIIFSIYQVWSRIYYEWSPDNANYGEIQCKKKCMAKGQ